MRNLLVLLRHKRDESSIHLINLLVTKSQACQQIIATRNPDHFLNSLETLQIVCRELAMYSLQKKPRVLLALYRIILAIVSHQSHVVSQEARLECMVSSFYFINHLLLGLLC